VERKPEIGFPVVSKSEDISGGVVCRRHEGDKTERVALPFHLADNKNLSVRSTEAGNSKFLFSYRNRECRVRVLVFTDPRSSKRMIYLDFYWFAAYSHSRAHRRFLKQRLSVSGRDLRSERDFADQIFLVVRSIIGPD
jgi:hypothetical protein